MAVVRQLLDHVVVAVLVRDEERSLELAAVGVLTILVEKVRVFLEVVEVDGTVKRDQDHLWGLMTERQVWVKDNVQIRGHIL